MVHRIFEILFLVSCLVALSSAAFNYCTLCKDHIACNNNGQFAKSCKNPKMLKFSSQNIKTALRAHDEVRNKIAGGSEKRFQPATKMPVLKWDTELAYHAELNVKRCQFGHFGCIKSVNKKYAPGQNIYMKGGQQTNLDELLKSAVTLWYNEVKNVDPKTMSGGGHFTQVVRDQCVAIGCAIGYSATGTIVTCNYSFGNIGGSGPVYVMGKAASACPKGRDSVFKNLCKV